VQRPADRYRSAVVHCEFARHTGRVQQPCEKGGGVVEQRGDDAAMSVPRWSLARRAQLDFAAHFVADAARDEVGRERVGRARYRTTIEVLDRCSVGWWSARPILA